MNSKNRIIIILTMIVFCCSCSSINYKAYFKSTSSGWNCLEEISDNSYYYQFDDYSNFYNIDSSTTVKIVLQIQTQREVMFGPPILPIFPSPANFRTSKTNLFKIDIIVYYNANSLNNIGQIQYFINGKNFIPISDSCKIFKSRQMKSFPSKYFEDNKDSMFTIRNSFNISRKNIDSLKIVFDSLNVNNRNTQIPIITFYKKWKLNYIPVSSIYGDNSDKKYKIIPCD